MTDMKLAFKTLLARNNISATQLASELGVHRKTLYSAFYTGNPRLSTIERVANHFKIKPSEFMAMGER